MRALPTQEMLKRHFRYDAVTGKLYWRRRVVEDFEDGPRYPAARICNMWNARFAGKEAFPHVTEKGYKRGSYCHRLLFAHQIVWALHHNEWPPQIDHKNGNRKNNRIGNLRAATSTINARNRKRPSNNTSGTMGVYFCSTHRRWKSQIGDEGKRRSLGSFKTKREAVAARKKAIAESDYHPNHGRKNNVG